MSSSQPSTDRKRKRDPEDHKPIKSWKKRNSHDVKNRRRKEEKAARLAAQAAESVPASETTSSKPSLDDPERLAKEQSKRKRRRKDKSENSTAISRVNGEGRATVGVQEDARARKRVAQPITVQTQHKSAPETKSKGHRPRRKSRFAVARHDVISANTGAASATAQSAWSVSQPVGGRFIDRRPMMSPDEKYLLCATETSINAYSTSDSILKNTLHLDGRKDLFTAFNLSSREANVLWAATRQGILYSWDFTDGTTQRKRRLNGHIQDVKIVSSSDEGDVVFALFEQEKKWTISSYRVYQVHGVQANTILEHSSPIRSFDVRENGSIVVAITTSGILVGAASDDKNDKGMSTYNWREITCSEPPMCFDVRVKAAEAHVQGSKTKSKHVSQRTHSVDVVIGGLRGAIYVFYDLMGQSRMGYQSDSRVQQLHWHREAVGAVAWSLDGQYLVSGGRETVLVLWQLETGRKQFLPNLESPIQDIVVSPKGSSYVVRLADNSVMILSASDLSPTCHVAGVQSNSFSRATMPTEHLPTIDLLSQFGAEAPSNTVAATINPNDAGHMMLSVPANQIPLTFGGRLSPAPYLQAFDVLNGQFVSRQAMTRTNATNVNLGPEGNSIHEPNVKSLQVSQDGRWLSTVDEWEAPPNDSRDLNADGFERTNTLESKLRFWAWDDSDKQWMLNSRIDDPHRQENDLAGLSLLALASDPGGCRFATLGADSIVRTWILKSKLKNGKIVRGEVGPDAKGKSRTTDTWWALEFGVPLEKAVAFGSFESVRADRGLLKFSNDGSMLAAYQHHDTFEDNSPVVHFIDTNQGALFDTHSDLYDGADGIHGMDFLGKHLILLGRDSAAIWDITSFDLVTSIPLQPSGSSEDKGLGLVQSANTTHRPRPVPHLAVNVPTNTFSIAMPEYSKLNSKLDVHPLLKFRTQLLIFSPESGASPVFETRLPRTTMALISAGGMAGTREDDEDLTGQDRGYVILDLGAEVRTIDVDRTGVTALPTPPPTDNETTEPGPEPTLQPEPAIDEVDEEEDTDMADDSTALPQNTQNEDTRPVVRREQLADVFDYPTLAMPPMVEMFKDVLKLYSEKPVRPADEGRLGEDDGKGGRDGGVGNAQVDGAMDVVEDSEDDDSESD